MRRRRRKKRCHACHACHNVTLLYVLSGCKDNVFIGYKRQLYRLYQVYTLSTARRITLFGGLNLWPWQVLSYDSVLRYVEMQIIQERKGREKNDHR